MGNAKHVGRVGALAAALGVGNVRRTATRMTVSIGRSPGGDGHGCAGVAVSTAVLT